MKRELIEKYMNMIKNGRMEEFYQCFGLSYENENEDKLLIEVRKFAKDINERDYEYIKSNIKNSKNEYVKEFLIVLIAGSNLNKIFKLDLIEKREKYGLEGYDLIEVITGIGDVEYTKECIEKREEYEFNSSDLRELITSIGDVEYTKECIEKREEYGLGEYNLTELITSIGDVEYTKECIEKREKHGLERYGLTELIISIGDVEYTKEGIEKREKYRFDSYDLRRLIISIGDIEYTKECIEKRGEYRFDSSDLRGLIISIGDVEYTKDCIEKREEYGLGGYNLIELIKSIGDVEYTKECIEKRGEYSFNSSDLIELIKSIGDVEYTKKCIEKRGEYSFNSSDLIELITSIGDVEYTKECISNKEKFKLSLEEKLRLLNQDVKFKYLCKKINGEYIFTDVIPEDIEGIELIDLEHIEKSIFDFKIERNEIDFIKQVEILIDSKDILKKLERNNFSLPYIYIEQLNSKGKTKQFCNDRDFRFFKSEFPKINEELLNFSEEERLDFFKFATSLGCFSTEKMLDKKGKETQVLLAQKASSLLAQLLKTEEMRLR